MADPCPQQPRTLDTSPRTACGSTRDRDSRSAPATVLSAPAASVASEQPPLGLRSPPPCHKSRRPPSSSPPTRPSEVGPEHGVPPRRSPSRRLLLHDLVLVLQGRDAAVVGAARDRVANLLDHRVGVQVLTGLPCVHDILHARGFDRIVGPRALPAVAWRSEPSRAS